jgi:hypothetical protein
VEPGFNLLPGHVVRSSFLGNVIRTELDIGTPSPVIIDRVNGPDAAVLAAGTAASVTWPIVASRLLAV